jgi:molybdate transport system substrate-binding protein
MRCRRRWRPVLLAVAVPGALLVGCGAGPATPPDAPGAEQDGPDGAGAELDGELVVFAAASLTDVVDELADRFTAAHPRVAVVTNLAGSQTLAAQLLAGAPADVFAAADDAAVQRVVDEGLAHAPAVFAENRLAIVVEPGNPLGIDGLSDLARDDVLLVLPAEQAAAGRYAEEVLDRAGVGARPASFESDVRAAVNRVAMGEADASVVFHSDVVGAGDRVSGVAIPAAQNVTARYPVVVLDDAPNPAAATAFAALLRSDEARAVLEAAGFGVPGMSPR